MKTKFKVVTCKVCHDLVEVLDDSGICYNCQTTVNNYGVPITDFVYTPKIQPVGVKCFCKHCKKEQTITTLFPFCPTCETLITNKKVNKNRKKRNFLFKGALVVVCFYFGFILVGCFFLLLMLSDFIK